MLNTHRPFLTCLASAALFSFLFHGTGIGFNLLLFEVLVIGALFALPYLIVSTLQLEQLDAHNAQILGGQKRYIRILYMAPSSFAKYVHDRSEGFLAEYPQRSWKEWNAADARAYELLSTVRVP